MAGASVLSQLQANSGYKDRHGKMYFGYEGWACTALTSRGSRRKSRKVGEIQS